MLWNVLQSVPNQTILAVLLITYPLLWIVYARYFHPLAKYPGPFLASISRIWLVVDVARGSAEVSQRRLHAKYGPIIRIAPNELAISDPEAIKTIYAARSRFTKTDYYLAFRSRWGRKPDIFTELDEHQHAERRKIVNSVYSMSNMIQLEEGMDRCAELLIQQLGACADDGKVIDIAEWIQWYAFDVIGELFYSRMFGFLEKASDYAGYINAMDLIIPIASVIGIMPTYIRLPVLISGAMIPRVAKALGALSHIENAAQVRVIERKRILDRQIAYQRKDMLQGFFDIMHEKGAVKDFGLMEVRQETWGSFTAGSDTTAAAITATLYYLMRNPSAYTKLNAEIEKATATGQLSSIISYREAVELPYLDACCKEAMRLLPSVALTLPRHVPKGGCVIAGQWIPEGTRVGVNAAVVHRDNHIFGDDADEFVPERWFRDHAANMQRYMFQFGAGSRTCIGKNIALCEMYKIIPQLLRAFHLELAELRKEWMISNHWFHKPTKVYTRLRKKSQPSTST